MLYVFRFVTFNVRNVHGRARFPFKRNRLRCVRCVNENRKKRKRSRWQAANHGCHCFDRAFLLAGVWVCCVKFWENGDQSFRIFYKKNRSWFAFYANIIFVRYDASISSSWHLLVVAVTARQHMTSTHKVFQYCSISGHCCKESSVTPLQLGGVHFCEWSETFGSIYAPFCHPRISWGLHIDLRQHLYQSWWQTVLQHHWQPSSPASSSSPATSTTLFPPWSLTQPPASYSHVELKRQ